MVKESLRKASEQSRKNKERMAPTGNTFVGLPVKVFWEGDKEFFQGTVKEYSAADNQHLVVYEDGEQAWEDLDDDALRVQLMPSESAHWISKKDFRMEAKQEKKGKETKNKEEKQDKKGTETQDKGKKPWRIPKRSRPSAPAPAPPPASSTFPLAQIGEPMIGQLLEGNPDGLPLVHAMQ